jgi:hypothetical protein
MVSAAMPKTGRRARVKNRSINVRLTEEVYDRLQRSTKADVPYPPTLTAIIERGIELALQELDERQTTRRKRATV